MKPSAERNLRESVLRLGDIVHYIRGGGYYMRCGVVKANQKHYQPKRKYDLEVISLLGDWSQPSWDKKGNLVRDYSVRQHMAKEPFIVIPELNNIYEINERLEQEQPFFENCEERLGELGVKHPRKLKPIQFKDPLPLTEEQVKIADKWRKLDLIKEMLNNTDEMERHLGTLVHNPQDQLDKIVEIIKTRIKEHPLV